MQMMDKIDRHFCSICFQHLKQTQNINKYRTQYNECGSHVEIHEKHMTYKNLRLMHIGYAIGVYRVVCGLHRHASNSIATAITNTSKCNLGW